MHSSSICTIVQLFLCFHAQHVLLRKESLKSRDFAYWQTIAMKCATLVSVDGSHFAGSTAVSSLYINPEEEIEGFTATTLDRLHVHIIS